MDKPINIFSGASGLGGALTNPTELARKKGSISQQYRVFYQNRFWPDVELAYAALKGEDLRSNDVLMAELIACKFLQHPELKDAVVAKGGAAFLEQCSHWTGAATKRFQAWEGNGPESRFIRNLIAGFNQALKGQGEKQTSLF